MGLMLAATTAHTLFAPLAVFLADPSTVTTDTIAASVKTLAGQIITVLQMLIPVVAVFRIIYRFAETKEGSLVIILAEVVIIIFLSVAIGQLIKAALGA